MKSTEWQAEENKQKSTLLGKLFQINTDTEHSAMQVDRQDNFVTA